MGNAEFAQFTVRIPAAMAKQLRKVAEREYSSLNREVTIAIRAHLDAEQRKGKRWS